MTVRRTRSKASLLPIFALVLYLEPATDLRRTNAMAGLFNLIGMVVPLVVLVALRTNFKS